MSHTHQRFYLGSALTIACLFGSTSLRAAALISSPTYDILLGGTADINGSTVDGGANYGGLPPANLNDGDRDGFYANGGGVDGSGSIAHTSGVAANQEMGVTITTPTLITSVGLFNRTDCCSDRIDGGGTVPFTLNIFNGATNVFTMNYLFSQTISQSVYNSSTHRVETSSGMIIPVGVVGTYVQIVQNNNSYMNLAELEAYTPEPASLTLFGLGALGLLARRR